MKMFVRFRRAIVLLCLLGTLLPATAVWAYNYTVVPGDSLYFISKKTGVGIDKIKAANNLSGDMIYPGQVLNIPDGKPAATAPQTARPQGNTTYTVKPGDSLYVIAQKYNIRVEALILANSLSGTLIYPGQQLIVPIAATRSATSMAVEVSRSAKRPVIPYTDEDLDLLARLVNAEAGGEPMEAQIGVAAVVINRVKSDLFPDTIRDVIYAPNQFTPVRNGWINRPATESSIQAAKAALYGSDPTNGALYFYDNSTRNSFLRSLPVSATYGQMIYAKR
ncbi:LysM domain-containing protein [Desulforamulus putei DSM 12395]|uniref:LysM domain-containing protein n=1 Tax=Desulforamulus putei DSM 12395 TaxID=1121429 RepID=A0A1M4TUD5_9FIRM|nr:cell wall hydrolase [Desulforamulus putei]SHE48026.1 LysM domain-containing protein [Desulforamulus putei DSM 12395]